MSTKRSEILFIISAFFVWRIFILLVAFFSIKYLPLFSHNYFGGSYDKYVLNPIFWGHLNFDGEHYLSIAQNGYQPLEYFFFPFFPYLIKLISIGHDIISLSWTGILISNVSFLFALFGVYKLIKLDFKESVARIAIILLLTFPTSFYFGVYYTESLFLLLVVWGFYFARKRIFLIAVIIAMFASATRVIGVVLMPVIFIEWWMQKNRKITDLLAIVLVSPLGLLYYMYFFLLKQTGDPLIFVHQVSIFGEQRSSNLVILPQVIYRYIFEIFPHVSYFYFPNVFTTYLEFIFAILFLAIIVFGVFKLRLSYSFYSAIAFIVPTLAGSFSSMPRYLLVIFPVFLLIAIYLDKFPKFYKYILFFVMIILFVIAEALFWRGYWVS